MCNIFRLFVLLTTPLLFLLMAMTIARPDYQKYQFAGRAQGTTYHVTYYAVDNKITQPDMEKLLTEIDQSLSLYVPGSLINRWNASTNGIRADKHLRRVVNAAMAAFEESEGYFDITIYPLTRAWGFGPEKPTSLPDSNKIAALKKCVGTGSLHWKGRVLQKRNPCIELDPNGIAQGYTVDQMAALLESKGIRNYLVELGGEIRVRGRKFPMGEKMSIGAEAPGDDLLNPVLQRLIYVENAGITSSGNYRRYYESQGQKISHLLDPHTGYPIRNELISVTLVAPDAMRADALDNVLMGMGLQRGLEFVERDSSLAALFIYRLPNGMVADSMSRRFRRLLQP